MFKRKVTLFSDPSQSLDISCTNDWPIPVTVELTVKGNNVQLADGRKLKSLHVLPPFSSGKPALGSF